MKKAFTLILSISFVVILFAQVANAQVTISGSTNADGTYTTLRAAMTAIGTLQAGKNITVSITANTTETSVVVIGAGTWATMTIEPSGGSWTITGSLASELIQFNGADNVTINGLNSGGNYLTISNTSTSLNSGTSTIRFMGDATNNTITNCSILGSATMALSIDGGNIWFSAGAVTTGNDNNTISYCNIGPAGSNLPTKAIYGNGTTTTTALNNSGITITNNNIYDYFGAAVSNAGIYIGVGNTAWTITNNKFYQTTTRTFTTGATHSGVYITNKTSTDGFTITGNTIGYASSSGTGTYTIAGALSNSFYGIYLSGLSTSTSNSINSNIISDISFTTTSTGNIGGSFPFAGINIASTAGIISVSNNLIKNITFPGTGIGIFAGIDINSSGTGLHTINGNTINNFSRTASGIIYGIKMFSPLNATFNNNTISNLALNNITSTSSVFGIYGTSSGTNITASCNSIFNLSTTSTAGATICGIREGGASGNKVFQNNNIYNLSASNGSAGIYGIHVTGISTPNAMDISSNKICTFSGGMYLYAIFQNSSSTTSNIYNNKIFDISTNYSNPIVYGLYLYSGTTNNVYNNMISDLRTTTSNTDIPLVGIYVLGGITCNIFFNTIYLNSTSSGSIFGSTCVYVSTTPIVDMRNNILVNTSTPNGAGISSAYRRSNTTLTTYSANSNNNCFYAGIGTNNAIFYDGTNAYQMPLYKTLVSPRDANSKNTSVSFVSNTDLHINGYDPNLFGSGVAGTGILTDFDGQTRTNPPCIGADEFISNTAGWTGNTSSDWNNQTNWSTNSVPTSSFDVVIGSNYPYAPVINNGESAFCNNLLIGSGKSLTLENGFTLDVKGNISNSGTITCGNTSTMSLSGTSQQNISGNSISFGNLTLNNSSGTLLCNDITINTTLTLTNGILYTKNGSTLYTVYFTNTATPFTDANETTNNRIVGRAIMNQRNLIGESTLSYLGVTLQGTSEYIDFTIDRITDVPESIVYYSTYHGIKCKWHITAAQIPTIARNVTYKWLQVLDNGNNFNSLNAQIWVSTDGTNWTPTGTASLTSGDPRSMQVNKTTFSYWTIADADNPLPVQFSSFTANVISRDVKLNWITASELNNAGFEILRSVQNDNWLKVGYMNGSGTKTTPTNYIFEDKKLNTGKYKYRLKQIDYNGNFEYHDLNGIVEIGVPNKYDISQNYPNPFNPTTKIDFDLPYDSKVSLKLYDMSGRELLIIVNEQKTAGYYTAQVNAGNLSSGAYFYRINAEGNGKNFVMTKKMLLVK